MVKKNLKTLLASFFKKRFFMRLVSVTLVFFFLFYSLFFKLSYEALAAPTVPSVYTGSASSATKTTVTLAGTLLNDGDDGNGSVATRGFEYGLTTSYGTTVTQTGPYNVPLKEDTPTNLGGSPRVVRGVGIDSNDDMLVSDSSNNQIVLIDHTSPFGGGQVVFAGGSGTGNGQFDTPAGIDVDSSDNVFVVDTGNDRVQKFDSSGTYVLQFGGSGTGNGQFDTPMGIGIDASDNIYVADTGNDRVQKFDSSGTYDSQFGSSGTGNGQFDEAYDVAINSKGNIFVTDHSNDRIQIFDEDFSFLYLYNGSGANSVDPTYIAVSGDDNRVYQITETVGSPNTSNILLLFYEVDFNTSLTGLACGTTYHYRAYATNSEGTGYGDDATFSTSSCGTKNIFTRAASSISATGATLNGSHLGDGSLYLTSRGFEYGTTDSYGSSTSESGTLYVSSFDIDDVTTPIDMDVDSSGNVYVLDQGDGDIKIYNSSGTLTDTIGTLNTPYGMSLDGLGNIYVANAGETETVKLDASDGSELSSISGTLPITAGIDSSGYLYVGDSGDGTIKKYDPGDTSSPLLTIGSADIFATGIEIDSDGVIYAADGLNSSDLLTYSAAGTAGSTISSSTVAAYNLAIDGTHDYLYVADPTNDVIKIFATSDLSAVSQFGSTGTSTGLFDAPYDVELDADGYVYVLDADNSRVQKFLPDFDIAVSDLTCGTTYHYRAYGTNGDGTTYGDDATFTTSDCTSSGSESNSGGSGSGVHFICTDPSATNYTDPAEGFGKEKNSICRYADSTPPPTPEQTLECSVGIYLTKPIKFESNNNPEDVKLLEKYLDTYEGYDLPIDGVYSQEDFDAVITWQEKYADEILKPWSLNHGTGYVYVTSLNKIRDIHEAKCQETYEQNTQDFCFVYTKDLARGDRGAEVEAAQKALRASVAPNIKIDGVFGPGTETQVKLLQSTESISQTGIIGPQTGMKLREVNCHI